MIVGFHPASLQRGRRDTPRPLELCQVVTSVTALLTLVAALFLPLATETRLVVLPTCALVVCAGAWNVLREGFFDLCVRGRLTANAFAASAAACALAPGVAASALSACGELATTAAGRTPLLYLSGASILTARLFAIVCEWGGSRSEETNTEASGPFAGVAQAGFVSWAALCVVVSLCVHPAAGDTLPDDVQNAALVISAALAGAMISAGPRRVQGLEWVPGMPEATVDVVLFQKGGVLTSGRPVVTEIIPLKEGASSDDVVHLAAVAEYGIEHPVRDAILRLSYAGSRTIPGIRKRREVPCKGIVANLNGKRLLFGNLRLLEESGWDDAELQRACAATRPHWEAGETVLYACLGKDVVGAVALKDVLHLDALEAFHSLHAMKIETGILSGDTPQSTAAAAQELGASHLYAGLTDTEVDDQLTHLRREGKNVAMVQPGGERGTLEVSYHPEIPDHGNSAPAVPVVPARGLTEVTGWIQRAHRERARQKRRSWVLAAYFAGLFPLFCGALQFIGGPLPTPALAAWAATLAGCAIAGTNALPSSRRPRRSC